MVIRVFIRAKWLQKKSDTFEVSDIWFRFFRVRLLLLRCARKADIIFLDNNIPYMSDALPPS